MNFKLLRRLKSIFRTKYGIFSIIFAIMLLASAGFSLNKQPDSQIKENLVSEQNKPTTTIEGPILAKSAPIRLRIPSVSIDAPFTAPLGLETNGEVAVPDSDTEVGWYKHSPTPGEVGPAVILGHVDSKTGPAVFFYLGQLDEGDDVFVDRTDGTTAHFKVESLERPKQSEFPTEKVYGNINYAGLRLITCSGIYLKGTQRYTNNLVVYARLIE
jgi:sortase (surface protein transpeptidase)